MTDPKRPPRARRLALCLALGAFFGMLGVLAVRAELFERIFAQLEMKSLPAPTEAFLAFAGFTRSGFGFALLTLVAGTAIFAVLRGWVDARLTALLWLVMVGGVALLGFFWLSLELPIRKLHEALTR